MFSTFTFRFCIWYTIVIYSSKGKYLVVMLFYCMICWNIKTEQIYICYGVTLKNIYSFDLFLPRTAFKRNSRAAFIDTQSSVFFISANFTLNVLGRSEHVSVWFQYKFLSVCFFCIYVNSLVSERKESNNVLKMYVT